MAVSVAGIVAIVCGSLINNLGIVLQKRQVNLKMKEKAIQAGSPSSETVGIGDIKGYTKDILWILGILMQTILCLPLLFFGISELGITLAQPLANAGVLFLVLGAVFLLKERMQSREYIGIAIVITGMILIGLGAVEGDITQSVILERAAIIRLIAFMGLLGGLVCILILIARIFPKTIIICLGLVTGVFYTFVSISAQLFTASLDPLTTAEAWGLFMGGTVGLILGTVLAIIATQEGFKRGQAVNFIPFSQITMNIFPIAAGLFVFGQIIMNPVYFWVGTFCIISGSSLLARFQI
jgi:drug/metabolite transporter (DMT)-like permease